MSRRLTVLCGERSWYLADLQRAGQQMGITVGRMGFSDLGAGLASQSVGFESKQKSPCSGSSLPAVPGRRFLSGMASTDGACSPETVLVRTMPIGSLEQVIFRMDVLRNWESEGVRVVNPPLSLETCIDKFLTLKEFSCQGIPFPETVACQTTHQAMDAFQDLGSDVVVKPIFGGEGRGIMRVGEEEMAYRVFRNLEMSRSVMYLQKFVANVKKDIRILLIGDQHFSMLRTNHHSWISNASMGGEGVPYQPNDEELEIAFRSKRAIGGQVVGIDLLQDDAGRYFVLEANAVPGWQLLGKVLQRDIAAEVLSWLFQNTGS
ncbi:MAG: RimK family alpha-L-glutamate ligase [Planctomycetota bacterium]|nr:RimK family alpha-L-glutamate ligase [Planctomycetota bacterium]